MEIIVEMQDADNYLYSAFIKDGQIWVCSLRLQKKGEREIKRCQQENEKLLSEFAKLLAFDKMSD